MTTTADAVAEPQSKLRYDGPPADMAGISQPHTVNPSQNVIRKFTHDYCQRYVMPVAAEMDRRPEPQQFPFEYFKRLAQAGIVAYPFGREYGGSGGSALDYNSMMEVVSYYDPATALLAAVSELAIHPIAHFGNEEQKKRYIPPAARGESVPAFALTEPEAGSDASNQQTTAKADGDYYIVNGEKTFIMHGDVADLYVLFCKIDDGSGRSERISTIIVDDVKQPGLTRKTLEYKMGMKAATTGRIWFKDVKVPRANLLGEKGKGFRYAMITLDSARVGVAAQGVGLAWRAMDESIKWAKTRQAFGQPIAKLQAIQWMIADISLRLESARCLLYKASLMLDAGEKVSLQAAQAKLYATEAANFCIDRAMQIHAGYGYIGEFGLIEKLYRDQRIMEIYEGTSEVQRLVIANSLLR
jgi:butyryl-CoA dehydrogenase